MDLIPTEPAINKDILSPAEPKEPKKGLLVVFLVTLGVLILAGAAWGGHCWWQSSHQLIGGQTDEHGCLIAAGYSWCEAKSKCLRTWEEPCTVDETAGWQTYRNEQYGFEVKYPGDWKFEVFYSGSNNTGVQGFFIKKGESFLAVLPQGGWDYGAICSVTDSAVSGKTVKVKSCERSTGFLTLYHFIDIVPSSWLTCGTDLKNCNRIDFSALNSEDLNALNQILSTFKFIDATAGPVPSGVEGWQTYKNQQYGYELKYPSTFLDKSYYNDDALILTNNFCSLVIGAGGHGLEGYSTPEEKEIVIDGETYTQTIFKKESEIYIMDFPAHDGIEIHDNLEVNCLDDIYQILSTFKFIPR